MTDFKELYNNWAKKNLSDNSDKRDIIQKWKASTLINMLLRNMLYNFKNIAEIGGSEGLVLNTFSKLLNVNKLFNYEISDVFCEEGKKKFPEIHFKNCDFLINPSFHDLIILSDITEHVENDIEFLSSVSKHGEYLAIKIPIEKCLFSSRFWHFVRFKKVPKHLKYGTNHINGHLRGYTVKQARTYISNFYKILDTYITSTFYFSPNRKKIIIKKLFGEKMLIYLYGGAFFAIGKSLNSKKSDYNEM